MPYQILSADDNRFKVQGGTRAGLMVASLQSLFVAAEPKTDEADETRFERPFAIKAPDFNSLIVAFLDEAAKMSNERKEVYDEVRFELMTDKVARGLFAGRPALKFKTPIEGVKGKVEAERNAENQWEIELAFKTL